MHMSQQTQGQDGRVDVKPGGETRGNDQRGYGARRKVAWCAFYSQSNLLSIHSTIPVETIMAPTTISVP